MNKKVFYFLCGVAACSVFTACSGQEATPTAASVSQSAASSESVSVSESVSSVAESASSSSSGDGTDLTTEYNPEGTAKEFTAEEAAIYGDIEALHERQYQETYDMLVSMGVSEEEAEKMARESVDKTSAAHEDLLESNEQYIKDVQEKEAQETAEDLQEFEETYGMSFEEFNDLTWQEQNELTRELVRSGKLPKGGVG